ncbi:hypothetical protein Tco_1157122 [Tanacetum coccineum]
MVRLWWSQWVRPPPQWWFWAADHPRHPMGLRHHSPTPQGAAVVAVPSSDRHHDGGGYMVAVGDGLVAWRGRRWLCRGGGGGTRLVEMEVMVASNEDDSEGGGGGVVMMGPVVAALGDDHPNIALDLGVLVSDLLCPLCSSAQEDSSHLLFSCRLVTDIVRLPVVAALGDDHPNIALDLSLR